MRYLTLKEVNEQYGGILPPDAVFRADDDELAARAVARQAAEPKTPPAGEAASPLRPPRERAKVNPVVRRVRGYRRFFDALPTLEPGLSPGAVALWAWLWTCEKKGLARCSERRLAERFKMARDTVRRRLAELAASGLIRCVRRGQHGRCATVYRVRPTPKRPTD